MPLFTGTAFNQSLDDLTAGLAQVLFPVVLLLGLTGLLVGILQSYDQFSIPAIAPAVWNLVIIVGLVGLHDQFKPGKQIYAYAIAWLIATVVQLLMIAWAMRRIDFRLQFSVDWRDPRVKQVFTLMLPVTIGLGIVNLDQLLNSVFGTLVSRSGAARDRQRVPDLHAAPGHLQRRGRDRPVPDAEPPGRPPRRRRDAPRGRERDPPDQPAADPGGRVMMVLATPITRLVFQRGAFQR